MKSKNKIIAVFLALILICCTLTACFLSGFNSRKETYVFNNVLDLIRGYYSTEDLTDEEIFAAMLNGLNDRLDPYSKVYTPEGYVNYNKLMQGDSTAYGFLFDLSGSEIVIGSVAVGSPAYAAGVFADDVVVSVSSSVTGGASITDFPDFATFVSYIDVPAGEAVSFEFSRGGSVYAKSIARAKYTEKFAAYYNSGNHGGRYAGIDGQTGVIRLSGFLGNASSEFKECMQQYKSEGKSKLILDMRYNGGGYLNIMCDIAEYLIKDGAEKKILTMKSIDKKGNVDDSYKTQSCYFNNYNYSGGIAVLINGGSASATEALVGCMLDYGTITYANIFGQTSYGKGVMQTNLKISYEYGITLTIATIYWPKSNTCINGVGIVPPAANTSAVRSEQLALAVAFLA